MNSVSSFRSTLGVGTRRSLCLVCGALPAAGIRVLAYHGIDTGGSPLSVHPDRFRAHLAYLKDNGYRTLSSSEYARQRPLGRSRDDREVMITFDDGFQGLHQYAFPVLKEFSFTAVVFLAVGYVGGPAAWIERDLSAIATRILPDLGLRDGEVDQHVEQLRRCSGRRLLSWDEIGEMHEYGIDFQSHSCTHAFFSNLTAQSVGRELEGSKAELEKRLCKKVECFAYPYGDYGHPGLKAALRETGYTLAFCDTWQASREKANDRYEINRVPVGNDADTTYLRLCFSAGFRWYRSLASLARRVV